jgi:hypothetical protein
METPDCHSRAKRESTSHVAPGSAIPGFLLSWRGLLPQPKMLAKKTRCRAFAVQE